MTEELYDEQLDKDWPQLGGPEAVKISGELVTVDDDSDTTTYHLTNPRVNDACQQRSRLPFRHLGQTGRHDAGWAEQSHQYVSGIAGQTRRRYHHYKVAIFTPG